MNAGQQLDRDLPRILGDLAIAPYPDYIDDVLADTAQRRQRPAWAFPERWLPMDVATRPVPTPAFPWRPIGVLALIAILLAAAAAVYIGTQQRRLPEPFGPAANGLVAYDRDGALYLFDPVEGTPHVLKADAEGWVDPWFSLDGQMLLVAHELGGDRAEFGVLPVQGGAIRLVTPEPLTKPEWLEWSADGSKVIGVSEVEDAATILGRGPGVSIIDTVAGSVAALEVPGDPTYAGFIPGIKEEVLVVTKTPVNSGRMLRMSLDGSDSTVLFETPTGHEVFGHPSLSPDGGQLAYTDWHGVARRAAVHILDLQTHEDRVLADDPEMDWTAGPRFSPDGGTIVVERKAQLSDAAHLAFIDVATGDLTTTDLAVPNGASTEWSPDGSVVVVSVVGPDGQMQPHVLVDPRTGTVGPAPWTATSYPSWQRVRP